MLVPLRAISLLVPTFVAACSVERTLHLEPPPVDGAASILVGVLGPDGATVHAADLTPDRAALRLDVRALGADAELELWAMVYRAPLAAHGFEPGLVESVEPDGAPSRELPADDGLFTSAVALDAPGASPEWSRRDRRPPALAEFRAPPLPTRCPEVDVELFAVESVDRAQSEVLVAVAPDRVLMGLEDGQLFSIGLDGATTPVSIDDPIAARAAYFDGTTLWLGGNDGRLTAVLPRVDRLVTVTSTTLPTTSTVKWLDVEELATGREIRLLTRSGEVGVVHGTSYTRVYQFAMPAGDRDAEGGIARVRRDEWVSAHEFTTFVVRVRGGQPREEAIPPTVGSPRAILQVPGLGTVLANSEGQFLLDDGGGWNILPGSTLGVFPSSLHAFDDGFVFGASFGNMGVWLPDSGFCPLARPVDFHIKKIAPLGADLVISGQNQGTTRTPYAILRLRARS